MRLRFVCPLQRLQIPLAWPRAPRRIRPKSSRATTLTLLDPSLQAAEVRHPLVGVDDRALRQRPQPIPIPLRQRAVPRPICEIVIAKADKDLVGADAGPHHGLPPVVARIPLADTMVPELDMAGHHRLDSRIDMDPDRAVGTLLVGHDHLPAGTKDAPAANPMSRSRHVEGDLFTSGWSQALHCQLQYMTDAMPLLQVVVRASSGST
jgi:hypothetical protein